MFLSLEVMRLTDYEIDRTLNLYDSLNFETFLLKLILSENFVKVKIIIMKNSKFYHCGEYRVK